MSGRQESSLFSSRIFLGSFDLFQTQRSWFLGIYLAVFVPGYGSGISRKSADLFQTRVPGYPGTEEQKIGQFRPHFMSRVTRGRLRALAGSLRFILRTCTRARNKHTLHHSAASRP